MYDLLRLWFPRIPRALVYNEWFWYQASPYKETLRQKIEKDEAEDLILQRRVTIAPDVQVDTQTERGKLFELLADLTDEDGALAEMQDQDDITDLLSDFDNGSEEWQDYLDIFSREKDFTLSSNLLSNVL
jgi:hypothetical protein